MKPLAMLGIWKPGLHSVMAALSWWTLACNNGCHCQLWIVQQSGALSGFQSTQPTSPMLQHYLTLPSLLQHPINTWTKMLCFKGSGESGKLGMHNRYYFFGALTSTMCSLKYFWQRSLDKASLFPRFKWTLNFYEVCKTSAKQFLEKGNESISLSLLIPLILAETAHRMTCML